MKNTKNMKNRTQQFEFQIRPDMVTMKAHKCWDLCEDQ